MSNLENKKSLLMQKRNELRSRLDAIEKDYREGLDQDSEEQAVQLANAEIQEAIAKSTSEELQRIEKKLAELN